MTRETRRQIEGAFYGYEARKQHAVNELADAAQRGLTAKFELVRAWGGERTSKVENAVLNLSDDYYWCKVVENILTKYSFEIESEVIVMKYFHKKSDIQTYLLLNISRRNFYYMIEHVLLDAQQWAESYGLLSETKKVQNPCTF